MTKNTTDELTNTIGSNFGLYYRKSDNKWLREIYDSDKRFIGVIDMTTELESVVKIVSALISNREKLARLERGIYELERLHHIPQMFGDWESVIDDRINTLRKELGREEPTNE